MLAAAVDNAGLGDLLDAVLSVEAVAVYKPHPKASGATDTTGAANACRADPTTKSARSPSCRRSVYQHAVDQLGVAADAIAFQSSNAWDAHAASAFGMKVVAA
jgi:2-haloacid dehalogenase